MTLLLVVSSFLSVFSAAPRAEAAEAPPASAFSTFITRDGDQLKDGSGVFRFVSANVPTLSMIEDIHWRIPTAWEQEDAFKALVQMGGTVTRPYVLSVRKADDTTEQRAVMGPSAPGGPLQFNEDVFKALDRMLQLANQYGVRIILPLVDQYQWQGGIKEYAAFRGKNEAAFWSDPQLIADFKSVIDHVVNRVNTITGVAYKDDPAILGWETGNELVPASHAWTADIAAYIKGLDGNHLVIDGKYGIDDASLTDPNVDIVSNHYYPDHYSDYGAQVNLDMAKADGKKAYIVGEFGFKPTAQIDQFLNNLEESGASGAMIWSLRMHNRDGGFYPHTESVKDGVFYGAYRWPGFPSGDGFDETNLLKSLSKHAYSIRGIETVPPLPVPSTPQLLPIETVSTISWLGSAGASGYTLERAEAAEGLWTVVGDNLSDAVEGETQLFHDMSAVTGTAYYYRLKANNASGSSEFSSAVGPVTAKHVIRDELRNFGKLYDYSTDLEIDYKDPTRFGGDPARLKMLETSQEQYVVYALPVPAAGGTVAARSLAAAAYFDPGKTAEPYVFATSTDGQNFTALDVNASVNEGAWRAVTYSGTLPADAKFVRIAFPADAGASELGRVNLEYDTDGSALSFPDSIQRPEMANGVLIDDMNNFIKMNAHDANLGFSTDNADAYFGGDNKRLNRSVDEGLTFTYKTSGDMNYFKLLTFARQEPSAYLVQDFLMFTSPDGVDFAPYGSAAKNSKAGDGWWTRTEYIGYKLPAGTKYLKFQFPTSRADQTWNPQVGQVVIGVGSEKLDPPAEQSKTQIVDDFESYSGSNAGVRGAYAVNDSGSPITLTLDNTVKSEGNYGLKLETTMSEGWGGLEKSLDNADWSGNSGIQLWVQPNGSDMGLTLQVTESPDTGGEVWKSDLRVSGSEPILVQVPFSRFYVPQWWKDSHAGQGNGAIDAGKAASFGLYMDGAAGQPYTVNIDDIRLYRQPTIDDFESYVGDDAKLQAAYTPNADGDAVTLKLAPETKRGGDYGLDFGYDLTDAKGYAGISKNMGGIDWSNSGGIQLWVKPDGQNRGMTVQFKESSGEYWEAKVRLSGTEGRLIGIPFHAFARPGWNAPVNGVIDLNAIAEFSLYVEKGAGAAGKGSLYVDDIAVAKLGAIDCFEFYQGSDTLLAGAYVSKADGDSIVPTLDSSHASGGDYGMKLAYELTNRKGYAGVTKSLGGTNWTSLGNAIELWLQSDGSGGGVTLQLKEKDGDYWEAQLEPSGTDGKLYQLPFSGFARNPWSTGDGALTLASMTELSIFVNKGAGTTGSHLLYVDGIQLASVPTIDSFDYYGGGELLAQKAYTSNQWGGPVSLTPDADHKDAGKYGLKYEYELTEATNFAGMTKQLNGMTWTGYDGLSFWLTPDGSNRTLTVQFIEADGEAWEAYRVLSGRTPGTVRIPFSEFRNAPWNTKGNGSIDLGAMAEFSLYVNQGDGAIGRSALYVDSIQVVKDDGTDPGTDPGTNPGTNPGTGGSGGGSADPLLEGQQLSALQDLRAALKSGTLDLTLQEKKTELLVPAADLKSLTWDRLRLASSDGTVIELPAEVVSALLVTVDQQQLSNAFISLRISRLNQEAAQRNLPAGYQRNGSTFELELALVKDGKRYESGAFPAPVAVSFPFEVGKTEHPELLGVFVWNPLTEAWSYAGGKADAAGQTITASLPHFSTYAVLEYTGAFADLGSAHWAFAAVREAAAHQWLNGVGGNRFEPARAIGRAEFVSLLVRALGLSPETDGKGASAFKDIPAAAWYRDAAAAAFDHALITGRGAEAFAPNAPISRQEIAALLTRANRLLSGRAAESADASNPASSVDSSGSDVTATSADQAGSASFADESRIAAWALDDVRAAAAAGWMQGVGGGRFAPQQPTTRAEAAQAIVNFMHGTEH